MEYTHPVPLISVIVPTRNRAGSLRRLLRTLAVQDYPNYEVIVVNNESNDDTERVIKKFKVRSIQAKGGIARVRQSGAECAKGEILAMTDDDCELPPDWLSAIGKAFMENPGAGIIGGKVTNRGGQGDWTRKGQGRLGPNCSTIFDNTHDNQAIFGNSNLSIRRTAFNSVGGYDPVFSHGHEETDLALRVKKNWQQVFDKRITVVHHNLPRSAFRMNPLMNRETMRYRLFFKHHRPEGIRDWAIFFSNEAKLLRLNYLSIVKRYRNEQNLPVFLSDWLGLKGNHSFFKPFRWFFCAMACTRQTVMTATNLLLIPYTARKQLWGGTTKRNHVDDPV